MKPRKRIIQTWAAVLATVTAEPMTKFDICGELHQSPRTIDNAIRSLVTEKLVERHKGARYGLTQHGQAQVEAMAQGYREILAVIEREPRESRAPHRYMVGPGPVGKT